MTTVSSSYGGSHLSFQIRTVAGFVELRARTTGLEIWVSDAGGVAQATQLIQWDQVAAWMEAARGADHDSAADIMAALAFGKLDDAFGDGSDE